MAERHPLSTLFLAQLEDASTLSAGDELEQLLTAFIAAEPLARPEVVAIRHPRTLERMERVDSPPLLLLFVRFGTTRLLDNRVLTFHMPQ